MMNRNNNNNNINMDIDNPEIIRRGRGRPAGIANRTRIYTDGRVNAELEEQRRQQSAEAMRRLRQERRNNNQSEEQQRQIQREQQQNQPQQQIPYRKNFDCLNRLGQRLQAFEEFL